jgi:hypothetical protein
VKRRFVLQSEHSNVRTSKPGAAGSMQVSLVGLPHLEHGGMPISERLNSGSGWIEGMMLPYFGGREHAALSVTDRCRLQGGDGTSMRFSVPDSWSKLLTLQKEYWMVSK